MDFDSSGELTSRAGSPLLWTRSDRAQRHAMNSTPGPTSAWFALSVRQQSEHLRAAIVAASATSEPEVPMLATTIKTGQDPAARAPPIPLARGGGSTSQHAYGGASSQRGHGDFAAHDAPRHQVTQCSRPKQRVNPELTLDNIRYTVARGFAH